MDMSNFYQSGQNHPYFLGKISKYNSEWEQISQHILTEGKFQNVYWGKISIYILTKLRNNADLDQTARLFNHGKD
jgi:hypothetical protein